jgi:diguanylate cyclase (GGDEF)-like protein/putative nucleotidyltransferase with HDIG domain
MGDRLSRLGPALDVRLDERRLAGVVSGVLYVLGGLTLASFAVLPGITRAHLAALFVISAVASLWGAVSICAIDWERAPWWLAHASVTVGMALIGGAIASTGGAVSPAWVYLFFPAMFAAYFYRRTVAIVYLAGCVAVHALPLLYDSRALHDSFIGQFVIAAPAYLVFGGAIIAGKGLMLTLRAQAQQLAAEHGALRRVATAVVAGEAADRLYELVAIEAAHLLGVGAAGVLRLENDAESTVMGSWADHPGGRYPPGTLVPIRPGSDVEQAVRTRRPARVDDHEPDSPVRGLGYDSSIVAPIEVAGTTWGVLAVAAARPVRLTAEDEERLTKVGNLLATAVASIEDRAKLAAQASTDPLTRLANHATFQQRLTAEVARAVRHNRPLSVAVIDIDHFKQINDIGGHEVGDEMLNHVAESLRVLARAEDTLGRLGGDEFAWLLPETTREEALMAVERARQQIADAARHPYGMTVSAGICDTSATTDPGQLVNFADSALYWSKAHGRNQCWIYDPAVVSELSAKERADRLVRSRALLGLQSLARAIDAKDPATSEHSERVSKLVGKLARTAGWSPERSLLLSQAALVHDVGKIGIPDAVLRKTAPLTEPEREQIKEHAELAARIVEDVLMPEQVEWIRTHHERPDGRGYPRGLEEIEIPEGAALLALADAWDVMTVSRSYSLPKPVDEALAECSSLVGAQFTAGAVVALRRLHAAGELDGAARRADRDSAPADALAIRDR